MFNNPPAGGNPNAPRAYLNYIFFDEQFNFVKEISGFKRVSQAGDGAAPIVTDEIKARKNGYVYVYLSNESGEPVYFDNFSVSHERGRLIAEDHYYAYGLRIASISSKSVSSSLSSQMMKIGYQGSFADEIGDLELNYNEFALRNYDPQIGRWTTADPYDEFASPYIGMGNNPVINVDPDGGSIWGAIWSFFGGGISGANTSALAQVACPGAGGGFAAAASTVVTAIRMAAVSIAIGVSTGLHVYNTDVARIVRNHSEHIYNAINNAGNTSFDKLLATALGLGTPQSYNQLLGSVGEGVTAYLHDFPQEGGDWDYEDDASDVTTVGEYALEYQTNYFDLIQTFKCGYRVKRVFPGIRKHTVASVTFTFNYSDGTSYDEPFLLGKFSLLYEVKTWKLSKPETPDVKKLGELLIKNLKSQVLNFQTKVLAYKATHLLTTNIPVLVLDYDTWMNMRQINEAAVEEIYGILEAMGGRLVLIKDLYKSAQSHLQSLLRQIREAHSKGDIDE